MFPGEDLRMSALFAAVSVWRAAWSVCVQYDPSNFREGFRCRTFVS